MWNSEIRFQISHHMRGKVTYVLRNTFIFMWISGCAHFIADLDFVKNLLYIQTLSFTMLTFHEFCPITFQKIKVWKYIRTYGYHVYIPSYKLSRIGTVKRATHYSQTTTKHAQNESFAKIIVSSQNTTKHYSLIVVIHGLSFYNWLIDYFFKTD